MCFVYVILCIYVSEIAFKGSKYKPLNIFRYMYICRDVSGQMINKNKHELTFDI